MRLLTCYVAITQEEKKYVLKIPKFSQYIILSDITFSKTEPIILLSEVDRKRPREVKSRLYQYISFCNYDYICSTSEPIESPGAIADKLQNKIGLYVTEEPIQTYSSFLLLHERCSPISLFSTKTVFIPTTSVGLLFMDFWNRYTCRLKEKESLAITLVALRHFPTHITTING